MPSMATNISSPRLLSDIGHHVVDRLRRSGATAQAVDHDHRLQKEDITVLARRAQATTASRALDADGRIILFVVCHYW